MSNGHQWNEEKRSWINTETGKTLLEDYYDLLTRADALAEAAAKVKRSHKLLQRSYHLDTLGISKASRDRAHWLFFRCVFRMFRALAAYREE